MRSGLLLMLVASVSLVLSLVKSGAAYRPTIVTGFTIPKCNSANRVYTSALHTFVNSVRSDIANGNGGAVVNKTSDYVTKERHMDGQTYSCYYEGIARGLLGEAGEHQRPGLSVIHFQKNHGTDQDLQTLLLEAYNFWLNDSEASFQRLIYPKGSYMGCALRDQPLEGQSDPYDFKVVCVFVDHRPKNGPFLVYPSGKPCKKDTDCSGGRTCNYGLCFAPVEDVIHQ